MKLERALSDIQGVLDAGRLPHALLVVGPPRGTGLQFTEELLRRIYRLPTPDATHRHVDIHWLEPEGKGRTFKTGEEDDVIRPQLEFLAQSSYEGGWKTVILLFADRLNTTGQNVLLKTLEEPPPNSLLMLVTTSPASLLPTVRSRLQTIDVADDAVPDAPWVADLLANLRSPPPVAMTPIFAYADALAAPLRILKAQAEDEEKAIAEEAAARMGLEKLDKDTIDGRVATRVKELREDWFRVLLLWERDLLAATVGDTASPRAFPDDAEAIAAIAARSNPPAVMAAIKAIEHARTLLDHNIRESVILPRLARALALPRG